MVSHLLLCGNSCRIRHDLVCGYSSSTFFASDTPFSFVARPVPKHHQRRTGSLVVRADAVRSSHLNPSFVCFLGLGLKAESHVPPSVFDLYLSFVYIFEALVCRCVVGFST